MYIHVLPGLHSLGASGRPRFGATYQNRPTSVKTPVKCGKTDRKSAYIRAVRCRATLGAQQAQRDVRLRGIPDAGLDREWFEPKDSFCLITVSLRSSGCGDQAIDLLSESFIREQPTRLHVR